MTAIRPPTTHVVLMDGTFASLADGRRSSIGRIYRLLSGRLGPIPKVRMRVHYGMGQQWNRWQTLPDLAMGRILELRITEAYGWLASGYQPGDRIFMLGYSRGAFAVRSLAGMISRVGLLRADGATERHIRLAWRYYQQGAAPQTLDLFRRRRCHVSAPIRMVGCFDTVTALGVRLPVLWMLTEPRFRFHDAHLGQGIERGYQALALDETRAAFAPLLWDDDHAAGRIEQMWFRGAHADIGGQLSGFEFARPLANVPLVWMLDRAEASGLALPQGWRDLFPCDATAPSIGSWRHWGKLFLMRAPRLAGQYATEALHDTVPRPYPGPALLTGALSPLAAAPLRRRRKARAATEAPSPEPPSRMA
nr:DUF2235 domain-containing protein [Paracoccus saliphilus]